MRVQRLEVFGLLLTLAWCVGCGDSESERGAVVNNGAADASNGDATDSNGALACATPVACGVDGQASPFGWGQAATWEIDGDLIVLGVPGKGMEIMDVSSQPPVRVGELPLPDRDVLTEPSSSALRLDELVVEGGLAFIISEFDEEEVSNLEIVDVSDPTAPSILSSIPDAEHICAVGEDFVILDGPAGPRIIDVSEPRVPNVASALPVPCGDTMRAVGSTLFMLDEEPVEASDEAKTGLRLLAVDLSTLHNPREVAPLEFEVEESPDSEPHIVHTDAGLVVTFSTWDVLEQEPSARQTFALIDVTEPTNLTLLSSTTVELPVPEGLTQENWLRIQEVFNLSTEVAREGSVLYLSSVLFDTVVFHAFEVSGAGAPTPLGALARQLDDNYPETYPFRVEGGLVRQTDGWTVTTIDYTNPAQPTVAPDVWLGRHPPNFSDIALSGTTAYVAAGEAGLRIFDVGCPSRPSEVSVIDADFGGANNFAYPSTRAIVADANGFAYASTGSSLHVIDATDLAAPVERAVLEVTVDNMVRIDQYLYIAGGDVLRILDVSDPNNLVELGSYAAFERPSGGLNNQLAVSPDGVAYLTAGAAPSTLHILDVSNVASPTPLAPPVELGAVFKIGLVRSLLFVMDGGVGGSRLLDVWDPNNVTELPWPDAIPRFVPFTIKGDRFALPNMGDGLTLYRVNDLDGTLEEIATFNVGGNRIAMDGDTMVVTTSSTPLTVVGIACE